MMKIADETIIARSPSPADVYLGNPSLFKDSDGRLFFLHDLWGAGLPSLPGVKSTTGECPGGCQSKVYYSDQQDRNWKFAADLPVQHGRIFEACNGVLYLIGQGRDLRIFKSSDHGETWSGPHVLDRDGLWMQSTCAFLVRKNTIFITMENRPDNQNRTWPGVDIVLLSASLDQDLTRRESWFFSDRMQYRDIFRDDCNLGIPFYITGCQLSMDHPDPRYSGDPCFLESHVLELKDENHLLYEPNAIYLVCRLHSGRSNLGAILCARPDADGHYQPGLLHAPSGQPLHILNLPGGHLKFHIIHDPVTRFYFLASNMATDSMTRPDRLPDTRYNLPDNERNLCGLYFSKNLFDWCFAGLIAGTAFDSQARSYPNMIIDGEDLLVVCRSGDEQACSAHNTNLATMHRIRNFRNYPANILS